jgi:hypothetical protein
MTRPDTEVSPEYSLNMQTDALLTQTVRGCNLDSAER